MMPETDTSSTAAVEPARALLRHTLATLAYRGGKAVRSAPPGFADRRVAPSSRTPVEILAHIGDLLDWAVALAGGRHDWQDRAPLSWEPVPSRTWRATSCGTRSH